MLPSIYIFIYAFGSSCVSSSSSFNLTFTLARHVFTHFRVNKYTRPQVRMHDEANGRHLAILLVCCSEHHASARSLWRGDYSTVGIRRS
jgi:hypothetical protein